MSSFDGRYAFIADWYDPNAALTRKYQLFYYPNDSTVEMVSNYLIHIFIRFYKSIYTRFFIFAITVASTSELSLNAFACSTSFLPPPNSCLALACLQIDWQLAGGGLTIL